MLIFIGEGQGLLVNSTPFPILACSPTPRSSGKSNVAQEPSAVNSNCVWLLREREREMASEWERLQYGLQNTMDNAPRDAASSQLLLFFGWCVFYFGESSSFVFSLWNNPKNVCYREKKGVIVDERSRSCANPTVVSHRQRERERGRDCSHCS